ncbi:MAG: DUF3147 family protein [Candidatus Gastranaerophilaceae bacterium]|jgi:uncharacterized membrane protein (GlpM family)
MLLILKIITSSLMIILITETAKRHSMLGGVIAVLPINILLSLIWLYIEKKDIVLLGNFTYSAFWGIFPTMFFLISITFLFNKHNSFIQTIFVGLFAMAVFAFLQHKILGHICK